MVADWVGVVATAFTLQLLALPGEKGQFVVGGLATRYRPLRVVAGASLAFALWTVVEILVGNALRGAFPERIVEGITAALFLLIGLWFLLPSTGFDVEGETDGSTLDRVEAVTPDGYEGFVAAFGLLAVGEVGDKTQLITIALAAQYGAHPGIWAGEMLAIVPVSAVTALASARLSARVRPRVVRAVAGGIFVAFGLDLAAGALLGTSVLPL